MQLAPPHIPTPRARSSWDARRRLDALARVLDSAARVPGTNVRVGADALFNLVPVVGPLATKALSAYLVWEARRLGVPPATLGRMLGNVGLDVALGVVPVVGWLGDVFFRANERNLDLLRAHLDPAPAAGGAR